MGTTPICDMDFLMEMCVMPEVNLTTGEVALTCGFKKESCIVLRRGRSRKECISKFIDSILVQCCDPITGIVNLELKAELEVLKANLVLRETAPNGGIGGVIDSTRNGHHDTRCPSARHFAMVRENTGVRSESSTGVWTVGNKVFGCTHACGNGSTIKHSKNSSATSTNASSLKIKLPAAFDEEIAEYQRKPLTGNRIIDMEVLLNLFLQLCCPRCFEEGILLSEDSTYGLCSNFVIRCKHCDFYSGFSSSKKTLNCPEVNTRFVYGMRQIGKGFSAGFKLCGTLNLPRLSKTAYTNHENKLMSVISEVSELSMQKAASELLVLHPTKNKIVECGISVDGTWQRRGYSSMNRCVAALSVDTGKVVDIEIMSSYCPTCRKISKMPRSIDSETFAADHVCHSNFQGSALKMEAVGATRIFQRSIVKRGLKYAHCGDGDSKGFISVKDTYGKDSVTKYECIGHVQKRVGARLRKLKSKNKNLSGKGKLTDSFIDRLQNYYGIAVRSNVGNLSGLQQNVIAALFHCSSSVEKPMHGQCPIGKDSWCYYQRALSCGKKPNEKYKGLLNEVLNTIKPTYLELCTKELLTKCLHGKTQNSNECLNGVIWQRVPKEVFVCLKILKSGALDAVIQFNDGYKGCVEIFKKLNI
ncbi:uncharacterized protein TNCV_2343921 [Trichonephila clavipes]|nr:uncharacterized protein TNCV_2343921 [Trichonephila clavipes]